MVPKSSAMCRTGLLLAVSLTASATGLVASAAGAGATRLAPLAASPRSGPGLTAAARPGPLRLARASPREPAGGAARHDAVDAPAVQELADPEPGSELRVSLITIGAGDLVWEMFGHNAIRIRDPASGLDVAYNWGMFDFSQEGFFWRFLLGDWQYWMAGLASEPMIRLYVESGRGVVEQELDLTPSERLMLLAATELNARPENRFYRYQYFLDNCSTRVRDAFDALLAGRLRARFTEVPGETFRFHTRRLTEGDPLIYVSLDFFMGGRGDLPISAWEEMFIPMMLRDFLRQTDLVTSETVLDEAARVPLAEPPARFVWFALVGAMLAAWLAGSAAVASSPRIRTGGPTLNALLRGEFVLLAGIWSLVAGLSGLVMIVSHFTSHEFMHWNENFFQANPLSLVLAGALVPAVFAGRWRRLASQTALLAAGVSVVGLVMQVVPGIDQVNGYYLVVAVPAHLAVAWGVRKMLRDGPEEAATR